MPKKLKFISIILLSLMLVGCSTNTQNPSTKVSAFLNKYIRNDQDLKDELYSYIDKQDITESQKERYINIIENEYKTIKYDIKNETIKDDDAIVEVNITVLDLYKASEEAENYLLKNQEEFYTNGEYDPEKFVDYKLDVMERTKDTKNYTIFINLKKDKNHWTLAALDKETLEKIHGIYGYNA